MMAFVNRTVCYLFYDAIRGFGYCTVYTLSINMSKYTVCASQAEDNEC